MKPDWDSLSSDYASSSKVIVADVDCTAGGKPLCDKYGVTEAAFHDAHNRVSRPQLVSNFTSPTFS